MTGGDGGNGRAVLGAMGGNGGCGGAVLGVQGSQVS